MYACHWLLLMCHKESRAQVSIQNESQLAHCTGCKQCLSKCKQALDMTVKQQKPSHALHVCLFVSTCRHSFVYLACHKEEGKGSYSSLIHEHLGHAFTPVRVMIKCS